ncbi:MAG: lysophospholipid acyltransferase family protein [Candidatus Eremiobacterota bacterium]
MIVTSTPSQARWSAPLKAAGGEQQPAEEPNFGKNVPNYTGPKDGLSHPKNKWWLVPLARTLIAGRYRVEIEGKEHLDSTAAQVICPTHPSAMDPGLVVALMGHRDVRYMSNIQMFRGMMGPVFTWVGAFPVNRSGASPTTMKHCRDILQEGKSLCIFPEGTTVGLDGQVGPFKKGAAASALAGGAESILPIAIEYEPDQKSRPGEAAIGALTACAVVAGGALAAIYGGPVAQMAAAGVGGALTGSYLLRNVVRHFVPVGGPHLQEAPRYVAGVLGDVVGLALGGTAAALTCYYCPSLAADVAAGAGLLGGLATWGWANIFRHRDIARVIVCDPIPVDPYRQKHPDQSDAVKALTEDMHRVMGKAKEKLTGVPYDENAPKIGGRVTETLAGKPLW